MKEQREMVHVAIRCAAARIGLIGLAIEIAMSVSAVAQSPQASSKFGEEAQ